MWTKINNLFTDNKLQRLVFLQQEFFGCHQNDSTIDAFCLRLKTLSDELNDVGFKVGDELLLSTLTAGLNEASATPPPTSPSWPTLLTSGRWPIFALRSSG